MELLVSLHSKLKVLVADDHFPMRQVVHNALREAKIVYVQMAVNGKETIELIERAVEEDHQPFDIVFLDWNMPFYSGIDVLNYFHDREGYGNIVFIMLTARSEQADVKEAIKAGALAYIVKPASQANVSKKLEDVIALIEKRDGERK